MQTRDMRVGLDASEMLLEMRGIRIYTENLVRQFENLGVNPVLFFSLGALRGPTKLLKAIRLGVGGIFTSTKSLFYRKVDIFHGLRGRVVEIPEAVKVITIHDLYPLNHRRLSEALRIGVDWIITPSNFVKKEIIQNFDDIDRSRISVVYMGIDHSIFRPRKRQECEDRVVRYGLAWKKYWIFLGSTDDRRKNFGTMAKAAEMAGQKLFVPRNVPQSELACLVTGAFGMLFVTMGEGFGLPPIEAMACGVPVIASKMGSIPEVVGDAALLVDDPTDAHEIADKMNMLLSSDGLRNSLISKGLARAKMFDWRKTAEKTLEVYRKALTLASGGKPGF